MANEAVYSMIAWYSPAFYRLYERLGFASAKQVADAAGALSGEHALIHECNQGITYTLPHCDGPQTPGQVLAAVACFVAWTQIKAGNPLPESRMLRAAEEGWLIYQMEAGRLNKTKNEKGKREYEIANGYN